MMTPAAIAAARAKSARLDDADEMKKLATIAHEKAMARELDRYPNIE